MTNSFEVVIEFQHKWHSSGNVQINDLMLRDVLQVFHQISQAVPVRRNEYFAAVVNALCVLVLIVTGFMIGHPVSIFYASEAYQQYWFGTVRFVHFMAAFVFFFMFLTRIYWGFVGNVYARWRNFIPFKSQQWQEIGDIVKVDVLQTRVPAISRSDTIRSPASFTFSRSWRFCSSRRRASHSIPA